MPAFPVDRQFRLLSHPYRRALLDCLKNHEAALTLADASEAITERVEGRPIRQIDPEAVRRTYMSLYHTHVPMLAGENVVRYSQDRDLLELTATGEVLGETWENYRQLQGDGSVTTGHGVCTDEDDLGPGSTDLRLREAREHLDIAMDRLESEQLRAALATVVETIDEVRAERG